MKKLFDLENPIMQTISRLTDLLILSILWTICALPLVTLGASTAALYYVTLKMVEETDSSVCASFFRAFRQNLSRGTVLTLIVAAIAVFLLWDRRILCELLPAYAGVIGMVFLILEAVFSMGISFLFPLLSRYENTVLGTLRNAFLLAVGYLPRAIVMAVLNLAPLAVYLFAPNTFFRLLPAWFVFAPGVIAYFCSLLLKKPFHISRVQADAE